MAAAAPSTELSNPTQRNIIWRSIQFVLQNAFCFWLQYRARGLEHLPTDGGVLLLINHQSYLDPLLVGLPLTRPISFLARDSLFAVPVVGWVLRNTYVMPINREAASTASLREALRRLDQGFYVGLFPEGTRTENGSVGDFKPGFLALVRRSNVPIVPVGLAGAFEAYPKGVLLPSRGTIRVVFGPPLERTTLEWYGKERDDDLLALMREQVTACVVAARDWRAESLP